MRPLAAPIDIVSSGFRMPRLRFRLESALLLRALFEQRLKPWQLAEWGEVGVLLDMVEVVVAGGEGFFQAGERQVEVSFITARLFRSRWVVVCLSG